ncbi:MAG TPA: phosphoenolpyruvate carboxykinase (ATP) [Bacillota bacterium]|nr:phosphoenolpyruvate carboxykinase (ATP) [Bacillota bacterium]HPZ14078.1 phosphoenolpyruvate carboxykinase (ATP) [Bacillota bacterium]HQD80754.1 phosphoenolpyruvate carboxykinase (ATP) [Bacillota bacterium]
MTDIISELRSIGLVNTGLVHHNLSAPQLAEEALARGEGILTSTGALRVVTGKYTGRSPDDKFIVDDTETHSTVDWGPINKPMSEENFIRLYARLAAYLQGRDLFTFDGYAGTDPLYELPIRVINEFAWQNLFAHQLFVRPTDDQLKSHKPEFTVIAAPGFKADPEMDGTNSEAFVIINFSKRIVIIGGTSYAGEMKKSVFSVMNYVMPKADVLPMHCSANIGPDGRSALFFGLSGTGKTTLSADPDRQLIGDDEHGWSKHGVFNIEGGCYAKCINLSREHEPQIWDAIRFGTVLENVVVDPKTRIPDYDDDTITENTRAAYPIYHMPSAAEPSMGDHPSTIIFLTADAFGVMPLISKLDANQAMYYFLSGYTSKLAGTERGIVEPEATFSSCFGAPFMPLPPMVYAAMLGDKLTQNNSSVYMVNTGWIGGQYGVGRRVSLKHTRAMVSAALSGALDHVSYRAHPIFKLMMPKECPGVPSDILDPKSLWQDAEAYDRAALGLAARFNKNFGKFHDVSPEIASAGPKA